jgi:hypothetical protein
MTKFTIAWDSNELVNQYNYLSSGNFFDKNTIRFFKSRVTINYKRLSDNEALFITTEKCSSEIRAATVRRATLVEYVRESDGHQKQKIVIETVGEFNRMTLAQAKREMNKL